MAATKPRWTQPDTLRRGKTASRLAVKHAPTVDPFLSAGARDQLLTARAAAGDEAAILVLGVQKTKTAAKGGSAKRLQDLIMAIRNTVARTANVTPEQLRAVGVGEPLSETDVRGLLAQVSRIEQHRAILVSCGVIDTVIDVLLVGAAGLRAAQTEQDGAKDARANTTEDRVDAQLTIERLVDEISSRGALAFEVAQDPVLRDRFARLVSQSGPTAEDVIEAGDEDTLAPTTTTTPAPVPASA